MTFFMHLSFNSFFTALAVNSIVNIVSYSQAENSFVLLTSDGGNVAGRPIHVLHMAINGGPDPLARASEAAKKIGAFLKTRSFRVRDGMLLTAGLNESLRFWPPANYTQERLAKTLAGLPKLSVNKRSPSKK